MPLKKSSRKPDELDSLSLYATLAVDSNDSRLVGVPERIDEVLGRIRAGLMAATSHPSTVYGWHAQNFFGALVAALDGVGLLKEEDNGVSYAAGQRIKIPDWSVVLKDGRRILVEVRAWGQSTRLLVV